MIKEVILRFKKKSALDLLELSHKIKENHSARRITFIIIIIANIFLFLFDLYRHPGDAFSTIMFIPGYSFTDFFNSISDSINISIYDYGVIYPPLSYVFLRLFSYFIPTAAVESGPISMRDSQQGIMVYFLFICISICLLCFLIAKFKSGSITEKLLFALICIFSAPMIFTIERGNIIIIAMLLMLYFVFGHLSHNKFVRETALIALGLAACIKVYPALLGILLIKNKRFREAFRAVIYGIVLFFIPFLSYGGFSKIGVWFSNCFIQGADMYASHESQFFVNFTGFSSILESHFSNKVLEMGILGKYFNVIMAILLICILIISKKKWQQVTSTIIFIISIPNYSYNYSIIYMIIPTMLFIDEKAKSRIIDWVYLLLFCCMFLVFPSGNFLSFVTSGSGDLFMRANTFIFNTALVLLTLLLFADSFLLTIVKQYKQRKNYEVKE